MTLPSYIKPTNKKNFTDVKESVARSRASAKEQFVDFAILLKPRVMSLVLFTGFSGMFLAPGTIDNLTATIAVICIAVGAGAAGAINMWYDRDIDQMMELSLIHI